ncbi:Protein-tyrosine-phosphatase IBR5 [Linum perenne]
MMRKRERENPCGICGHYHKYEEGEVCGICGHRIPDDSSLAPNSSLHISAFPSEILPHFLYLGSYDNASRPELLKSQGITRILNAIPTCQNLYNNSFTYHCLQDNTTLQFDEAIQILEQCERDKARILVHCMSGKSRSPALVIAYLMKSKGWRLAQSYQWVKERRPSIELAKGVHQQLQELEQKLLFSAVCDNKPGTIVFPPTDLPFGFPTANDTKPSPASLPAFSSPVATSIFGLPMDVPPQEFQFGAGLAQSSSQFSGNTKSPSSGDISMDR